MIIPLDPAVARALFDRLAQDPDAEPIPGGGFTCDLYDLDPPVALELYPAEGGIDVAAAFTLRYDEGLGGHYLGDKLETPESVRAHIAPILR